MLAGRGRSPDANSLAAHHDSFIQVFFVFFYLFFSMCLYSASFSSSHYFCFLHLPVLPFFGATVNEKNRLRQRFSTGGKSPARGKFRTSKGEIQISKIFKIQKKWKMAHCPLISAEAMKLLFPFSTTYLCESGFSAAVAMKTKARNKLAFEDDMICALSTIEPRISALVHGKQLQISH